MKDASLPHLFSFPVFSALVFLCVLGTQPARARVELQPCKNSVPPEKQIQLGQKAVQQVYAEMPILPDSSPVTQYIQTLGQKLAEQAPGYRWSYNFHVVDVADINAFALPGGSIFVNLGTIQAADTEAQLAGVMAHEISHVVLQHSVCNIEKEQRVGTVAGLGQIASGVLLGSDLGGLAQRGIGLTASLGFLKMSRGAEQQADLEGVGILYDSGYDPRGMPQFFETVEAKYGKGGTQLLSDHPNPGHRTEYVNREIATFQPRSNPITNTPEFQQVHQDVAGMRAYTAKEVAAGVWKHRSPNQTVSPGGNQDDTDTAADVQVDTAPPQNWTTFQGSGFTMQVPSIWQAKGNQTAAMVAPPGGILQDGSLVYGVLTSVYTPHQPGSLRETFNALLENLTRANPGLQAGTMNRITIGGMTADSVKGVNHSANNGRGEHDWVVGLPMGSSIRFFVFVAPETDFNAMRPTFERILNSVNIQ